MADDCVNVGADDVSVLFLFVSMTTAVKTGAVTVIHLHVCTSRNTSILHFGGKSSWQTKTMSPPAGVKEVRQHKRLFMYDNMELTI